MQLLLDRVESLGLEELDPRLQEVLAGAAPARRVRARARVPSRRRARPPRESSPLVGDCERALFVLCARRCSASRRRGTKSSKSSPSTAPASSGAGAAPRVLRGNVSLSCTARLSPAMPVHSFANCWVVFYLTRQERYGNPMRTTAHSRPRISLCRTWLLLIPSSYGALPLPHEALTVSYPAAYPHEALTVSYPAASCLRGGLPARCAEPLTRRAGGAPPALAQRAEHPEFLVCLHVAQ
jgi:hypothetical protein